MKHQEKHDQPIYCLAWSNDIYDGLEHDLDANNVDEDEDQGQIKDDDNNEKMKVNKKVSSNNYLIFATCSGRYVNLYQVASSTSSKQRAPLEWIQYYKDSDKKEQYYACAFAGRAAKLTPKDQEEIITFKENQNNHNQDSDDDAGDDQKKTATLRDNYSHRPVKIQRRNPPVPGNSFFADHPVVCSTVPLAGRTGSTGTQLLCVAGHQRVIQVIDTSRQILLGTLVGHGGDILDLRVHPIDEYILASAGQDNTARLWNLKTGTAVAVLSGQEGHLDAVSALAWHPSGYYLASGSMDTTVKLWDVGPGTPAYEATLESHRAARALGFQKEEKEKQYPSYDDESDDHSRLGGYNTCKYQIITQPVNQTIPIFTSYRLHFHCVDCVAFWGDCLLSRSQEHKIILWHPGNFSSLSLTRPVSLQEPATAKIITEESMGNIEEGKKDGYTNGMTMVAPQGTSQINLPYPVPSNYCHLRTFVTKNSEAWFIRFGMDLGGHTLAVGNEQGEIYVWDLSPQSDKKSHSINSISSQSNIMNPSNDNHNDVTFFEHGIPAPLSPLHILTTESKKGGGAIIRYISFSPDGNFMVASTDKGTIFKWDVYREG